MVFNTGVLPIVTDIVGTNIRNDRDVISLAVESLSPAGEWVHQGSCTTAAGVFVCSFTFAPLEGTDTFKFSVSNSDAESGAYWSDGDTLTVGHPQIRNG